MILSSRTILSRFLSLQEHFPFRFNVRCSLVAVPPANTYICACIMTSLNGAPLSPFRCGLLTTLKACMMTPKFRPVQSPKHGIRMASALRTPYQFEGSRRRMSRGPVPLGDMARRRPGASQNSFLSMTLSSPVHYPRISYHCWPYHYQNFKTDKDKCITAGS